MSKINKISKEPNTWRVLALDDKIENLRLVKVILESKGSYIEIFDHYEDFMQSIERVKPNMFILDIAMPEISGVELLKKLRQEPKFVHTPIIALTALAILGEEAEKKMKIFDGYITKPFKVDQLMDKLNIAILDFMNKNNLT